MTRIKKTRTGGLLAPRKQEREGPSPNISKGKNKGKGKKAGNRQQQTENRFDNQADTQPQDKRLGSKKPISLTAKPKAPVAEIQAKSQPQDTWPPKTAAAQQKMLEQLEQDPTFMEQLNVLEEGGVLPAPQLAEFEQKLERYDWLLEQLGLNEEDEDDEWDELSSQGKSLKDEWQ